jgi:S1-C subfamily serine protease
VSLRDQRRSSAPTIQRRHFARGLLLAVPALAWLRAPGASAGQRDGTPDFVALIERATPALVAIAGAKQTLGSGFFVRPNLVVTAAHVAQGAGSTIVVVTPTGRRPARAIATEAALDLALLEVSGAATATLPLATAVPKVGEWIVVLGNPFGAGVTATAGIVSAAPGTITATPSLANKLQINAAVNPGNSGGPVCNLRGEVVAVASALVPGGQGIAFATPATALERLLPGQR